MQVKNAMFLEFCQLFFRTSPGLTRTPLGPGQPSA